MKQRMDQCLIEAVFEHHSRSHAAINCLQDQLHSLELLRDSAQQSFTAAQEFGADLEKSSDSLLRSSSRYLIPSPDASYKESDSNGFNLTNKLCDCEISPTRMRLSETQMSGFDVSALLAQVSPPRPFANGVSPLSTSKLSKSNGSAVSGDELLGMLEKISLTGHQLQTELENAKMRESTLVKEVHQLKSKENGFQKPSPTKSITQYLSCPFCNSPNHNSSKIGSIEELTIRCDKLQDAMLSLQDENMKLNRLLKQYSHVSTESETSTFHSEIKELNQRLAETKMHLMEEREKFATHTKSMSLKSRSKKDVGTITIEERKNPKYCEVELENLCSRLQVKADTFQKQNSEYLQRIRDFESRIGSINYNKSTAVETFNLRIDDLHKTLLTKDGELKSLKEKFVFATKELDEREKKTEKIQSKDITKRKEVLLLCEKYDQLKKNVKRLESDLHESQKKLQQSTTKTWALETSCQKNAEENEILRHQLELHESFMKSSKASKGASSSSGLLKDYERLTEKYEALLDLRLREYQRVKVNAKNKRVTKQINIERGDTGKERPELRRALVHEYENDDPMLSESMWKRQHDFRRFYAQENPSPRLRSQSAEEITFTPRRMFSNNERIPIIPERTEHNRRLQVQSNLREDPALQMRELEISEQARKIRSSANRYSHNEPRTPMPNNKLSEVNNNLSASWQNDMDYRYNNKRNVMTSTPVKNNYEISEETERGFQSKQPSNALDRDQKYSSFQRKEIPVTDTSDHKRQSRLTEVGRSPPVTVKTCSRSLSPIRNNDKAGALKDTNPDYRPASSSDSQKSVSFRLNGVRRRSKSSNSRLDVDYAGKIIANPICSGSTRKGSISPIEVLERVKSAYQEEYLQNMRGVDLIISPNISPPITLPPSDKKSTTTSQTPRFTSSPSLMGAVLCADRYRKSTESVKELLEKSYAMRSDFLPQYNNTKNETKPNTTTPPKSILKKKNTEASFDKNCENTPVVVREKFSHHESNSTYNLTPPEMFRDSRLGHQISCTGSEESSQSNDTIEIIDVKPKPISENGTPLSPNSSGDSEVKSFCLGDIPKSSSVSDAYKHFQDYTVNKIARNGHLFAESKVDDLTIPIQFTKSMKDDDDTDSLGQSSVSSTRDHIGRFEFLQEMQSTLKNPSFAYQKPPTEKFGAEESKTTAEKNQTNTQEFDLGLSARQQEYADKLIKKYMKKSDTK